MVKKPKAKDNILSRDERRMFVEATKTDEEELAVKGLLYTGMRVSEFIHMRKDWIDWNEGIIHIPLKMKCSCYECGAKRKNGGWWTAKTKHAERPIPLLPEVKELLRIYFEDYDSIMELLDNRVNVWKMIRRLGGKAGIGHKVFPHCLRATFATVLVERGLEDPVSLTQIMGWADIKLAMVYIRLSGVGLKKKIDKIWNEPGD